MFSFLIIILVLILHFSISGRLRRLEDSLKQKSGMPPDIAPTPAPAPTPVTVIQPVVRSDDRDLEFKLGSKAFTAVGVVAVLLGVGFFLRYAFDQNLITEAMRVALGILGGIILLGLGFFLRGRYSSYAQAISGGGLALFYLTTFAAFEYYQLIGYGGAFFGMAMITILGVCLALFYDSFPLIAFAQIGGFLSPLLISSSVNHPHVLFIYLVILNFGMFAIILRKGWSWLMLGNFIGTIIVFMSWFFTAYRHAQFDILFLYATIFFLIFLATTLASRLLHRLTNSAIDLILTLCVPLVYFGLVFSQLDALHSDYTTFFTAVLGVLYVLLGFAVKSQVFWGLAFFFFVVAVPMGLDRHGITVAWALLGLTGGIISLLFSNLLVRILAYGALVATAIRIVFFDARDMRIELTLFFVLCLALLLWSLRRMQDRLYEDERSLAPAGLFIAINLMLLWLISVKVVEHVDRQNLERVLLSVAWTLYAVMLLLWGIIAKSSLARTLAIALFGIVVFKVFLYDTVSLNDLYRFVSFISLGVILLVAGFLYYRYKDRIRQFITVS